MANKEVRKNPPLSGQQWGLTPSITPSLRTLHGAATTLLIELDAAFSRSCKGGLTDERMGALVALTACMAFMHTVARRDGGGPIALRRMATSAIFQNLAGALVELEAGVVAPILKPGAKQNRPLLPTKIRLDRAYAAVAVHGLVLSGFSVEKASRLVADEIKGRPELDGISAARKPWRAVARWRQDIIAHKDRVSLDDLKNVRNARPDIALFDEWAAVVQERFDAGVWDRQAAIEFVQRVMLTILPRPEVHKG